MDLRLQTLLESCIRLEASDLHLSATAKPMVRLHGELKDLEKEDPLSSQDLLRMANAVMTEGQMKAFQRNQTIDIALSLNGRERFRINIFNERGRVAMAIRRLDSQLKGFEELNLPLQIGKMADLRDGLVLMTGPTGSGKTTTLATLIHRINQTRASHILTIEDPIEYVFKNEKCLIRQRELYSDVGSFQEAVRAALREDPDVILVGEMRDVETMRAAIIASETGHLVFSTVHCGDAVGVIDRIVGSFAREEQESVRNQLSMTLRAVVNQRLIPRAEAEGRVPAVEILIVTPAVANLIRTAKPPQIYSAMEIGTISGMQTLEQSLADLVRRGLVRWEETRRYARDPKILDNHLRLNPGNRRPPSSVSEPRKCGEERE